MAQKDSLIERLTDYYLSRKDYAFPAVPKSMDLMEGQYFSRTFRQAYPKFNGLIWAYHWLQVGLYEPFLEGGIPAEKKAGVKVTVARFWSMLEDSPSRMPKVMPMTSAIAPRFSERHPRAAAIFDNLHMMHDIISDILVADTIPPEKKREVIYAQLDELQDTSRNVMSWDEWRNMGETMGGGAVMGGPATALLAGVHAPVTPSPETAGMGHGAMRHEAGAMRHDAMEPGKPDSAAGHDMGAMADTVRKRKPDMPRGKRHQMPAMQHPGADSAEAAAPAHMRRMMDLHMRMMADPVIRQRVMADAALRRLIHEMMAEMPAEHGEHTRGMMEGDRKGEPKDSAAHREHEMPDRPHP
jgi:hypothetical protein